MKILKRLLILSLCFSLIVPSIPAYATGLPAPPVDEVEDNIEDTRNQGDSLTTITEAIDKANDLGINTDGIEAAIKHGGVPAEAAKNVVTKTVTDKQKANTRIYGVNMYITTIKGITAESDAAAVAVAAEQVMMNPVGAEYLGFAKYGGSVGSTSSVTSYNMSAWTQFASDMSAAEYFEKIRDMGHADKADRFNQIFEQTMASGGDEFPIIVGYLAIADESSGHVYDLAQINSTLSVCSNEDGLRAAADALYAVTGSTMGSVSLGLSATGAGLTSVQGYSVNPYTGNYNLCGYAVPLKSETPPEGTFYVQAQPKNANIIWTKESPAKGSYVLKFNYGQKELAGSGDGIIEIEITADFNATYDKAPKPVLIASGGEVKLSNANYFEGVTGFSANLNTTTSTIQIPAVYLQRLCEGSIVYNMDVRGGSRDEGEQSRPASFKVKINGKELKADSTKEGVIAGFVANGSIGYNYTSWNDKFTPTEVDTAYDKHTTTVPQGESLVVANTTDGTHSWDASVGIPSTENVSIKTGAQSGMIDTYGWLCARPYNTAIVPGDRTKGITEDDDGSPISGQAATRTITLKGMVTDCWGSDNPVCQLSQKAIYQASGGDSNSNSPGTATNTCSDCGGGSYSQGTCSGWSAWKCSTHTSTGWTAHAGHTFDASPASCETSDGNGGTYIPGCGGSSESQHSNNHNCKWGITIYDSINEDYLGQSMPLTGSDTGRNENDKYGLVKCYTSPDTAGNIDWSISWKPSQDKQYYIVTYSVTYTQVGSSSAHGDNAYGSHAGQPDFPASFSNRVNSDGVLCNDYTHGTGTSKKCFENMVHKGTHHYTITYTETVDAYVYRTIENASVYSLTHISLDDYHTINRKGGTDFDGEVYEDLDVSAPLYEDGGVHAVSAPDAVGYLWKCVGTRNGEYINGNCENGNGRILWEAWVDSIAKSEEAGNVKVDRPTNYFLGDVVVEIKATQDSEWATTIEQPDSWDTISGKGVNNNGELLNHIHDHNSTSVLKYETTASDTKYLKGPVGDQTKVGSTKTSTENDHDQHEEVVLKEIKHIMNYWSGVNSGLSTINGQGKQLFYKANIISDQLVYGGTAYTNSFLEDAYSVDGDGEEAGVALFNMHAKPDHVGCSAGINESTGEVIEAYRQHQNNYAATKVELKEQLVGNVFSKATVDDLGDMALFGGVNSVGLGGSTELSTTVVGQMLSGFTSEFGLNCSGTKGDTIPITSVKYTGIQKEDFYNSLGISKSGMRNIEVINDNTVLSPRTFKGYWKTFNYPFMGSTNVLVNLCGESVQSGISSISDVGQEYIKSGVTMGISNIRLVDWTPNGYWYTGMVSSHYVGTPLTAGPKPEDLVKGVPRETIENSHKNIVTDNTKAPCGFGGPYLNQIKIYNPLSVENDYVIGAQLGRFEESPYVSDDTDHDQRINADGTFIRYNSDYAVSTKPYVVQSQYLWTWISPFGNFSSVGGNAGSNSAERGLYSDGAVHDCTNTLAGYVDNMQNNLWIGKASIAYPFIAGGFGATKDDDDNVIFKHTNKTNVDIPVTEMVSSHTGSSGKGPGPSYTSKLDNNKFYWGNAYAVTNTCNVIESDMDNDLAPTTKVTIKSYGINPFYQVSDSQDEGDANFGYIYSREDNASGNRLANAVFKEDPVNLVGSIGNVTIHDVEDFRFSNYFKEPTSDWLIDGVIKKADINKPIRVVSSLKDICFNDVTHYLEGGNLVSKAGVTKSGATYGHSTLGVTIFDYNWNYGGMAGYYDPLPLVPHYNVIDEYRTEAVRLGYKSFISVDTIGQYQSYLKEDETRPNGPGESDTRSQYLAVESEYYLYDLDDGKFYDVDLWSGSTGGKERIYNGTTKKTEQTTHAGAIYQNVREDSVRRNIGLTEEMVTTALVAMNTNETETARFNEELTYLYSNSHYIGRPGSIRLDNRDLSYIGSSNNHSENRFWGKSYIIPYEFNNNAQRYHFKDGLTSTTVITEPLGSNPTQAQIMDANQKVREEHPHSVLVQFMNFTAVGEVWQIKHNGSAVMQDTFTIFDTNGDDPDTPDDNLKYLPKDWQLTIEDVDDPSDPFVSHNTVKYQGTATYNPITGVQSGTIDKDSTPIVVYQAYHTSADDRTISGTH